MSQTILKIFNTDLDFWESNPNLKIIPEINDLYKKDKSKSKTNSSQIMWAIVLLVDLSESNPYRNTNEEARKAIIAEDWLKDPKFDFKPYQPIIKRYEELCITQYERELLRLRRMLLDRGNWLSSQTYTIENGLELDKMVINSSKIFEEIDRVEELLNKDKSKGNLRGGAIESAGEEGII